MISKNLGKRPDSFKESWKRPPTKREIRQKKIVDLLRKGPRRAKEIPHKVLQTLYNDLNHLINIGAVKPLDDHRYAWVEHSELDVKVRDAAERLRKEYGHYPKAWAIAREVGRSLDDPEFKESLFKLGLTIPRSEWYHVIDYYLGVDSDRGTVWIRADKGAKGVHRANECPAAEEYRSSSPSRRRR